MKTSKVVFLILLWAATSGCASWTSMRGPTPAVEQIRQRPQAVRAHLKDGSVVSFRVPAVRGDTIHEVDRQHGSGRPISVYDIAKLEVQEVNAGMVILTGAALFVGTVLVLFATTPFFGR